MAMPTATPQGTLPNNRQSPLSLLFPSGPHPAMPHTHQEVIWGKSRPMVLEASVQGVQGSPPPEVGLLIHQLRKLSLAALEGGVKKGRNGGSQARGKETNQVSQHRRSRWGRLGWGAGPLLGEPLQTRTVDMDLCPSHPRTALFLGSLPLGGPLDLSPRGTCPSDYKRPHRFAGFPESESRESL